MVSDLPDFERNVSTPPVGRVVGEGMWSCGAWLVRLRRRPVRDAPAQTHADRNRSRPPACRPALPAPDHGGADRSRSDPRILLWPILQATLDGTFGQYRPAQCR